LALTPGSIKINQVSDSGAILNFISISQDVVANTSSVNVAL